jgi:hypothetical protein
MSVTWGAGEGHTIDLKGSDVFDNLDGLCVGVGTGVVGVETVDVGHEEEVVCVDHSGGDGGEGVIVTELDFLSACK